MIDTTYGQPAGGLPKQTALLTERAVFTNAYAFIPRTVMRDIVTSRLPGWRDTRLWILARPLSGFAETFSQYFVEVDPGGGSADPEPDEAAQAVLFVTCGELSLDVMGVEHALVPGSYVYLPPSIPWKLWNESGTAGSFLWIRKRYEAVSGLDVPGWFLTDASKGETIAMPHSGGRWRTTRFVDPDDLGHDMHVNIVTIDPGGAIPFEETHVMEHGLYVLEGKGLYRLNRDWVETEAGDFMWLRAFCPQACLAAGDRPFRYLLYKDVNRHVHLTWSKPVSGRHANEL